MMAKKWETMQTLWTIKEHIDYVDLIKIQLKIFIGHQNILYKPSEPKTKINNLFMLCFFCHLSAIFLINLARYGLCS